MPPADPPHPAIGETIRALRRRAGLTQGELYRETNIHPTEISRIERGKRNPTWETMKKLASGLRVRCWEMVAFAEALEGGAELDSTIRKLRPLPPS
jgi:transcriptional regulator with XRE-family HTH domain